MVSTILSTSTFEFQGLGLAPFSAHFDNPLVIRKLLMLEMTKQSVKVRVPLIKASDLLFRLL